MTSARKATMKAIAANARNRMPSENANRSPRVCSWWGGYRSWARIDPGTGNPLKAVLAASTRISAVTPVIRNSPSAKSWNTASASWAIKVF